MKRRNFFGMPHGAVAWPFIGAIIVLLTGFSGVSVRSAELKLILEANGEYDRRTEIRPSTIPNAGNGLFAVDRIRKGEVIGEYGGRLISHYPTDFSYIANLAECAWHRMHPYKYIDGAEYGSPVTRINFAPSEINGVKTNFQNAGMWQGCESPYFAFVALRDIEPGEEIWSSYGSNYHYADFMGGPEIQTFFCGLLKIDCRERFDFVH